MTRSNSIEASSNRLFLNTQRNSIQSNQTISRNEMMLLERILEKDDEIKELRQRLDLYQGFDPVQYWTRKPSLSHKLSEPQKEEPEKSQKSENLKISHCDTRNQSNFRNFIKI